MSRLKKVSLLLFFFIIGLVLYSQSVTAYFVSDDWDWLRSAHLRGSVIPDLSKNYLGGTVGGSYNPVSSVWINSFYAVFGLKPLPFHLGSIALHCLTAWLITILLVRLGAAVHEDERMIKKTAVLAGFLFLIWPTHVEAVAWISSVPHLLATFFFVLSLIMYFEWRKHRRAAYLIGILISSLCAFMAKETALTLPIVLCILELMLPGTDSKPAPIVKNRALIGTFLFAGAYLLLRFNATGISAGSYADQTLIVRPAIWFHTFATFFEETVALGLLRIQWSQFYFHFTPIAAVSAAVVIISLSYGIWKTHKKPLVMPYVFFIVTALPFIPLGFSRVSSDAERYTYLPSVFFISCVSFFLISMRKNFRRAILIIGITGIALTLTWQKTDSWRIAGLLSQRIVKSWPTFIASQNPANRYVVIGLPDTVSGAHVFRNGIIQALTLTHSGIPPVMTQIPVYQTLTTKNYDNKNLSWRSDERGFFANSIDHQFLVTGVDRVENPEYIFELWNYDYTSFTSDTIRLILKDQLAQAFQEGSAQLITWDTGALTFVPYSTR